ncbi:hypothetical protein FIU87_13085 [Bacillus sp. THAF10]|nr:hypothetical protein FIU87_13085 [Bacillus sp. THAF10]
MSGSSVNLRENPLLIGEVGGNQVDSEIDTRRERYKS